MATAPPAALIRGHGRPARSWMWWLAVLALLAIFGWAVMGPAAQRQTHGFVVLYTSARLVVQDDPAILYDDRAFNQAMGRFGIHGIYDIDDANPPTAALLLAPLAALPPLPARAVWIAINAGLLLVAASLIAALLRDFGLLPVARGATTAGVLAGLLIYHPLAVNFALGQAYLLLLVLLAAAMLALVRGHPMLSGLALAGVVAIKGYYGVLLLPLIPARQWRALGVACGASLALALASLPLLGGTRAWAGYLHSSGALAHDASTTVTAYQTLHGLIGHLLWRDPRWNPDAPLNLPALAGALWLLGVATLLLLPLANARTWDEIGTFTTEAQRHRGGTERKRGRARRFHLRGRHRRSVAMRDCGDDYLAGSKGLLLMVPSALLAAPMAEEYHYTLLALPLIFLWGYALAGRSPGVQVGLLALATVLAASPLPTSGHALHGAVGLLYYSKLAAALLVLIALLRVRPHAAGPRHPPDLGGRLEGESMRVPSAVRVADRRGVS